MAIGTSFHGREKEFAWLRGMFDAVATKGPDGKFTGPRMAVQATRLVHDARWSPNCGWCGKGCRGSPHLCAQRRPPQGPHSQQADETRGCIDASRP